MGLITGIFTAIKAWDIWARLFNVFGWLLSDVWRLVAAVALVLSGIQTVRIDGAHLRVKIWIIQVPLVDVQGWRVRALADEMAEAKYKADLAIEQESYAKLQAALNQQNAAVSALGADSAQRVASGSAALVAANARSAQRAAEAQAIVIPPAANGKSGCPTPADVIAAKGDL